MFSRFCNTIGFSGSFLSPSNNQYDINSLNWGGDSALAIAISQSDFPTIQMFLNSGSNIKHPGLFLSHCLITLLTAESALGKLLNTPPTQDSVDIAKELVLRGATLGKYYMQVMTACSTYI